MMYLAIIYFGVLTMVWTDGFLLSSSKNKQDNCCVMSKLNINATRSNLGRAFFESLIKDNQSFKNVNEQNMCMFVLYDSSKQLFKRLMQAKNTQKHSDEHQTGYLNRLKQFALHPIKSIFKSKELNKSIPDAFIYVRGDESSHFRERGSKKLRNTKYPAYGMDITHGCLPNRFGHILFGELKPLYDNNSIPYSGDRIYIKPEEFGIQKFKHYIRHSTNYIQHMSRRVLCRLKKFISTPICSKDAAFRENTDATLTSKWNQILSTISSIKEKFNEFRQNATKSGIYEIYRQTSLFKSLKPVKDFRDEIEKKYGADAIARKGHEIIFTTEQLLGSPQSCEAKMIDDLTQPKCPLHEGS
ncbi:unnamed protein product [Didymodactylos carnosus]|uniref:Uncharacterized protein n=1 Tax=Didymodactylos carnosus TaxID=1234261 RepID=A0A814MAX9_9BILA|nr:unnamed protein product [Didymodactylos carnosus]CAF3842908.1 unnamed protein product [Didymodactylos carnosus]